MCKLKGNPNQTRFHQYVPNVTYFTRKIPHGLKKRRSVLVTSKSQKKNQIIEPRGSLNGIIETMIACMDEV